MVIMYQSSRLLWHLAGKWLVHPKFFTLVNLLADRELAPEFMPYFTSIDPIVRKIDAYLQAPDQLASISNEMIDVVEPLIEKKAGEEVAKVMLEMLK